ncbi:sensor histidine kinase [Novosphingobium album (ex Liu et al. 2023)]|uniref:Sensor histidine kinase n=1 Tax=Novosphingobium album (ex Liu et al. 2023) TaxID=3031130 RepID=A0ABT5WPZ6_9SPHN|nr:sensor histidine kinase [Novosphingobium album (ex Liu et al. 2023)]MDE8652119.1 sensor histidine kinase [Novosphingobium album (ex Liu et al. 2023)]
MHFDDRLATVLRLPVRGTALARIQYRQLLDILGSVPANGHSGSVEPAYARLRELGQAVPVAERARMLRDPVARLRNPRLIALLAEEDPAVATAAIAAARIAEDDWLALIPALPVRARGILRHRRDLGPRVDALLDRLGITDRGLPPCETDSALLGAQGGNVMQLALDQAIAEPEEPAAPPAEPDSAATVHVLPAPPPPADAGIGAIVRRIEEFRRSREHAAITPETGDAPRLPLDDAVPEPQAKVSAFDFTTDAAGRIVWADAPVAPMAVGLRLGATDRDAPARASLALAGAIRYRQPLRDAAITLEGARAIAGDWQIDALPRFDPVSGRFTGYTGRFRRPATIDGLPTQPPPSSEADRMRQILHELRTPANAIQVAAEIILQQLFGPTPHEYRALASAIIGDAAHVFAGFDELDRLVKLDSGAMTLEPGTADLGQVLTGTVARLRAWTDPRRSGFALSVTEDGLAVGLDPNEAERLVWRLLAALAGMTGPDEVLALRAQASGGAVIASVALPASLAGLSDAELLGGAIARPSSLSAGMFGIGFTLRLSEAEAKAAGGSLKRYANELHLTLPGLTAAASGHSQD